jgi:hypothetical protein
MRPIEHVYRDLATALAYQRSYQARPSDEPLVARMREQNDQEVRQLEKELERVVREGCCGGWPKPCTYHEGWLVGWEARDLLEPGA